MIRGQLFIIVRGTAGSCIGLTGLRNTKQGDVFRSNVPIWL